MIENLQKWTTLQVYLGSALVDYILTLHDCYDFCKCLCVYTMNEISEKFNLGQLIENYPTSQ